MYLLYIIEFLFPGKLIIVFIIDKDLWFKILLEFQEQCLGKQSMFQTFEHSLRTVNILVLVLCKLNFNLLEQ